MHVLITRPHAEAIRTADLLISRGHRAYCSPLTRVERVDQPLPLFSISQFSALLATSSHTFECLDPVSLSLLTKLPVICVGQKTAYVARSYGFTLAAPPERDAQACVAAILARDALSGMRLSPLLYLAGVDRKAILENLLQKAGYTVESYIVYEAKAVGYISPHIYEALIKQEIDVALHYSRRHTLLYLDLCLKDEKLRAACRYMHHICLSEDVAEPLMQESCAEMKSMNVRIAAYPTEEALIQVMQEVYFRAVPT